MYEVLDTDVDTVCTKPDGIKSYPTLGEIRPGYLGNHLSAFYLDGNLSGEKASITNQRCSVFKLYINEN